MLLGLFGSLRLDTSDQLLSVLRTAGKAVMDVKIRGVLREPLPIFKISRMALDTPSLEKCSFGHHPLGMEHGHQTLVSTISHILYKAMTCLGLCVEMVRMKPTQGLDGQSIAGEVDLGKIDRR